MKELESWEIEEIIDDEDAREKLFATFKAVARQLDGGKTGKVTLSFSMSLEPNGMGGTCLETNVKISGGITQKSTVAARTKFLTVDEGPQMRFDFENDENDGSESGSDSSESGSDSDSESDCSESEGEGEGEEENQAGRDNVDAQDEGGEAGKCAHCDENGFCANPDNGGGFKCCNCASFTPREDLGDKGDKGDGTEDGKTADGKGKAKPRTVTISSTGISDWALEHHPEYWEKVETVRKGDIASVGEVVRIVLKNPDDRSRFDLGLYECTKAGPRDDFDRKTGKIAYSFRKLDEGKEGEA